MAYFDNAATTYPKPDVVYSFMNDFYKMNEFAIEHAFLLEDEKEGLRTKLKEHQFITSVLIYHFLNIHVN